MKKNTEKYLKVLDETGRQASLEMLYHHYFIGNDGENVALVNTNRDLIAVNYNGANKWKFILAQDVPIPDYLLFNNKKKIKGTYKEKDLLDLEKVFQKIYNLFL